MNTKANSAAASDAADEFEAWWDRSGDGRSKMLAKRAWAAAIASAQAPAPMAVPESLQTGDVRPIVIGGTLCEDGRWWCEAPECYVDPEDCDVLPMTPSAQAAPVPVVAADQQQPGRDEWMARIQSADENARAAGHTDLFLTLTCPNRFHAGHASYDGSTPRDATQWLRKMWARARAELARRGVRTYGVRIAEPHRDGCPHWHAMLWLESSAAADGAVKVFRKHWLREDGDERGARRHRVTDMRMEGTGGAAYVAKYISKGLHCTSWAATWGIRQFQTIGMPVHGPAPGLCE